MTILNPWILLGIVLALAASAYQGYQMGRNGANADHLIEVMKEASAAEVVRGAIRDEGQKLSKGLEEGIGKIKIEEKTVNRYFTKEKEVHHVLSDSNCTYPPSTVRVLNSARGKKESATPAAGKPDGKVPAPGTDRRKPPVTDGRNG